MTSRLTGLVALVLVLSFAASAWADIPPPPPTAPEGLDHPPSLGIMPIAVAGAAAALAVSVGGLILARYRGGWAVRIAALGAAAVIVAAAGIAAFGAARSWQAYNAMKAKYDDEQSKYKDRLSHWHGLGPPRLPPYRLTYEYRARVAAAALALVPQDGFPCNVPWGVLAGMDQRGD
ncbi:MAG TPA: hypothetical protein VMS17_24995 [Gemmataceae bacterium]|nr:hypothetical protein [Gemmataceae bacterium]